VTAPYNKEVIFRAVIESRPKDVINADIQSVKADQIDDSVLLYALGWAHAAEADGDKTRAVTMLERALSLTESTTVRDGAVWALADCGRVDLARAQLRRLADIATHPWEREMYEKMLNDHSRFK
jgi:Flp pilus assembly protein TadD